MEQQYFLHKHLFQPKRGQKRAKRPNKIVEATQLEIRPKKPKGQQKLFRPNNLKKASLATLGQCTASQLNTLADFRHIKSFGGALAPSAPRLQHYCVKATCYKNNSLFLYGMVFLYVCFIVFEWQNPVITILCSDIEGSIVLDKQKTSFFSGLCTKSEW